MTKIDRPAGSRLRIARPLAPLLPVAMLFAAAGRLDWTRGWAAAGVVLVVMTVQNVIVRRRNPALMAERMKKPVFAEGFDKIFYAVLMLSLLASFVIPGLDAVRFRWSNVPFCWTYVGIMIYVLGDIPVIAAMSVNPFLILTVRIQEERGHTVVTSGAYRYVRHPMYVGILIMSLGWPLMLGSLWTYAAVPVLILAFVIRTALEDRTLRRSLPGYEEYCAQTRYRLIPRIW